MDFDLFFADIFVHRFDDHRDKGTGAAASSFA